MVAACLLRILLISALRVALCAPAALLGAGHCLAQQSIALADYPVRPIRVIVASSPGAADEFPAPARLSMTTPCR